MMEDALTVATRRTPQGVRGLKCLAEELARCWGKSHPARGAWIEIWLLWLCFLRPVAPRKGCVD